MTNILDRWILARLEETIELVTKSLDDYQSAPAVEGLETFVEDFSTWYIRRSRDRIGPAVAGREDKNACYKTMFEVLTTLSKLLAPFMPYISDYMYTVLTGEESVHLANWPEIREEGRRKREEGIERQMSLVREIASLGHGQRKSAGIPVRQPLSSIKVSSLLDRIGLEFEKLLLDEVNVKKMTWIKDEGRRTKDEGTNFKVELETEMTDELKREGEARRIIRLIQKMRRDAGV